MAEDRITLREEIEQLRAEMAERKGATFFSHSGVKIDAEHNECARWLERVDKILASAAAPSPGSETPARALETAPAVTQHVHCSKCGKRCSGVDPDLGLVVRAWVECPECLESEAVSASPAGEPAAGALIEEAERLLALQDVEVCLWTEDEQIAVARVLRQFVAALSASPPAPPAAPLEPET